VCFFHIHTLTCCPICSVAFCEWTWANFVEHYTVSVDAWHIAVTGWAHLLSSVHIGPCYSQWYCSFAGMICFNVCRISACHNNIILDVACSALSVCTLAFTENVICVSVSKDCCIVSLAVSCLVFF